MRQHGTPRPPLRRHHLLALLAICTLLGVGCAPAPDGGPLDARAAPARSALEEILPQQAYRIGINTEVTGAGAQIGDLSIRAARLAVEEINAAGGVNGLPLELVVRDCRSDVEVALEQYRAALSADDLVALLGPVKSAYAVPMVREHLGQDLPLFIGATNTTLTEQGDESLFRMRPSIRVPAAAMAALAIERLGARRPGIIYDTDLHGANGAEQLAAELAARGLAPVVRAGYITATSDYEPLVSRVFASQPDVLLIYGTNPTDIGLLLRSIRYHDRAIPIVTSPGGSSAVTHNLAGDAQDGIYVAIDSNFAASSQGRHFEQAFRERFSLEPDTYIAWYYDSVHLLAQALARQPYPPDLRRLNRDLHSTLYTGAQGVYRFDETGEGLHHVSLARMEDGAPVFIGTFGAVGGVGGAP